MKLLRSDTPEITRNIDSARILARRYWPAFVYNCSLDLIILFFALASSLFVSVRAAALFGTLMIVAWTVYAFWSAKSSCRNWTMAVFAGSVYVRLCLKHEAAPNDVDQPDVVVFDASEIDSMMVRSVETFLYGPKPKLAECLVIQPSPAVSVSLPHYRASLLDDCGALGSCGVPSPSNLVRVTKEDGRLIVAWRSCDPALRVFIRQVKQELPSLVLGPEEHSELDLNGIWHGLREEPNAQQRRLLVQAAHLGFGDECIKLLSLHRSGTFTSIRTATAYLVEIELEEVATNHSAVSQ